MDEIVTELKEQLMANKTNLFQVEIAQYIGEIIFYAKMS